MDKVRVGVLRGGPSDEYGVSLQTGGSVLRNLSPKRYKSSDILIDKRGMWHYNGLPKNPERIFAQVDVVFNEKTVRSKN